MNQVGRAAAGELFTLLDNYRPAHLAPMLRAERDLTRGRLAAGGGDPGAAAAFAATISSLRELSTPYHLAHGLLDYAGQLLRLGDTEAAEAAIGEARHRRPAALPAAAGPDRRPDASTPGTGTHTMTPPDRTDPQPRARPLRT